MQGFISNRAREWGCKRGSNEKTVEVDEIDEPDDTLANKTFEKVEEPGETETEHVEIREEENIIPARALKIRKHREESHIELQKKARKMKEISSKKLPIVLIGQTVKIKIPEVDRSKVDARTLLAVVLQVVDEDYYRLGTKAGTLSQLFTRNQFTLCEENFLESAIIPDNEIEEKLAERCSAAVDDSTCRINNVNCKQYFDQLERIDCII
ncbi:hypothetical protein ACI65C_009324 [Semiaphis heraclei]